MNTILAGLSIEDQMRLNEMKEDPMWSQDESGTMFRHLGSGQIVGQSVNLRLPIPDQPGCVMEFPCLVDDTGEVFDPKDPGMMLNEAYLTGQNPALSIAIRIEMLIFC